MKESLIGHKFWGTELEHRLLAVPRLKVLADRPRVHLPADFSPSYAAGDLPAVAERLCLRLPLVVSIPDKNQNRRCPHLRVHTCGSGPSVPSFHLVEEGLYVACAELALVQVATSMSDVALLQLMYRLCGKYTLSAASEEGLLEARPLTSTSRIFAFAYACKGMRGARKILKLLPYVVDGVLSPMEHDLILRMCLPYRRGGYGLPLPLSNGLVKLSELGQFVSDTSCRMCDLYWPEYKVALEYDGALAHEGKATRDIVRSNALTFAGVKAVYITKEQYRDFSAMDRIALVLAKSMGRSIRPGVNDHDARKRELFRSLQGRYRTEQGFLEGIPE